MSAQVKIEGLSLAYGAGETAVLALDRITLTSDRGQVLGLVGESGSGKSTLGFALGRLLPQGVRPTEGRVEICGLDVWNAEIRALRALRRKRLRFIFQDPVSSLDPTRRIGRQIAEAVDPVADRAALLSIMDEVGLHDHDRVLSAWPHQLSGGMAQRVAIAIALIAEPDVIVADEATSALDASVRARILALLRERAKARGITLWLLSHDLHAVRRYCDRVAVMYAGRIVEEGPLPAVFDAPAHPYTAALLAATPGLERPGETLPTIPGTVKPHRRAAVDCAFAARCAHARPDRCRTERPEPLSVGTGRSVLCHFPLLKQGTP
ncbi:MAG: ABC transporter ATP-binding protein [Rhodobacteraceae bacterium]|nr:ABC transporter ATP-binding protein [Paracoccaceae bacterium]